MARKRLPAFGTQVEVAMMPPNKGVVIGHVLHDTGTREVIVRIEPIGAPTFRVQVLETSVTPVKVKEESA